MTKILVIDDETYILSLCRQMLEREGFLVVEAGDGNLGIEICRSEPIDLVITDILMPDKEGLETIVDLRNEFPKIKILAMSGGGRIGPENYLETAVRMGAEGTLKKPFSRNDLLKKVCHALS